MRVDHQPKKHTRSPLVQCAICFGGIKKPNTQGKTLACTAKHVFHQKCIWKWLVRHEGSVATCPLCREPVDKFPEYQCQYNEHVHYINALEAFYKDRAIVSPAFATP